MCELLAISSDLAAEITLSLMTFAEHGGFTGPHRDGWGIAYYAGRDVRLIREAEAAADSDWVRFITDHALTSQMVIAHIRHATRGARSIANTQPFIRELGGRIHTFAHNGDLPDMLAAGWSATHRFQPVGETDSERAFCLLLERLADAQSTSDGPPALAERLAIFADFAGEMRALGPANFLYSDGEYLFAHGDRRKQAASGLIEPPGLMRLRRQCPAHDGGGIDGQERPGGFESDGLRITGAGHGREQHVVVLASVALTDEAWEPFAAGEIAVLGDGAIVARKRPGHEADFATGRSGPVG